MRIIEVKYIKDYILECHFEDGEVVTANFLKFLKNARNPMVTQFRDKERFAQVEITSVGSLTWEDGQMDIPYWSVYDGEF